MKNTIAAILLLLVMISALSVKAEGIEFIHDKTFAEMKEMAKAQNKLIFMDCFTTWCGPCKRLSAQVFPDPAVGEYFNANFINVKVDMEKGEGPELSGKFGIRAYPTLLWIDENGEVKHKVVGGLDPTGLLQNGKKAIDPTPGILTGMKKRYADGDREVNFLSDYIGTLNAAGEKADVVFNEYLTKLSNADFTNKKHAQTIFNLTTDLKSPGLSYIMKNKEYYANMVGVDAFNKKINTIATKAVSEAPKANDVALFEGALDLLKSNKAADAPEKSLALSMDYYNRMNDWTNYDKAATQFIKKYATKNPSALNEVSWNYFLNVTNADQLQKATKWAYTALNTDNKYTYNLTYAYLLYKQENYKEAERACDYAIIRAKEENIVPSSATSLKEAITKSLVKQ